MTSLYNTSFSFFSNYTATTEIYTLSLHDALPIYSTIVSGEETPLTIDHANSATIDMTEALAAEVQRRSPRDAAQLLAFSPAAMVVDVLQSLNPAVAQDILDEFPAERRGALLAAASPQQRAQWLRNDRYPEDSIGRMMEPPTAVFRATQTIAQTIDA